MAKAPKDRDDDDEVKTPQAPRTSPTAIDLIPAAAEDVAEGDLPSQLQPYPTGNPQPQRDYFGRYINEDGKPIDADGNLIPETP